MSQVGRWSGHQVGNQVPWYIELSYSAFRYRFQVVLRVVMLMLTMVYLLPPTYLKEKENAHAR